LLTYFGGVRWGIPGGLLAVLLGTGLAWHGAGLGNWISPMEFRGFSICPSTHWVSSA
jgi:hypothetical protein